MKFSRLYTNRLQEPPRILDTVVVIDVLRSFTTAAVALARGARAIYPVEGAAEGLALAARLDNAVTVGAIGGGDPMPGFDYGNSPSLLAAVDLAGKAVVLSSAAGVRALRKFRRAPRLYAASLVCASATAEAIRAHGVQEVCFVITGEWVDRDGDEDIACADYIEALLRGEETEPAHYARRVRESSFGQRFTENKSPHLHPGDLDLAASSDCYALAMPVRREEEQLLIR